MARRPQANVPIAGATTSPTLLNRVRQWQDHRAWTAFFERYDPMMRSWCGRLCLDADTSDELCQRIWIELMTRMRTFRYDPGRGFRSWLWWLFRSRAIDMIRQRRSSLASSRDDVAIEALSSIQQSSKPPDNEDEDEGKSMASARQTQAAEVQAAVRSRVDPDTWRAYWMIAIEDRTIRETADSLGKAYTAVYNGYKRVDRMLRMEGNQRLAALGAAESDLAKAD
jgi:RNA polymerase sigma factor (sigma-70 family)